jgi:hypothetical protein
MMTSDATAETAGNAVFAENVVGSFFDSGFCFNHKELKDRKEQLLNTLFCNPG